MDNNYKLPEGLPLEKQFEIAAFRDSISTQGAGYLRRLCYELFVNYIVQQETYKHLIAKQWGIDATHNKPTE